MRIVELSPVDVNLEHVLDGTPIGHLVREDPDDVHREVLAPTRESLGWIRSDGGISLPPAVAFVAARR